MRGRSLFIITGAAAWIGGMATAMTGLSCDAEPCGMDKQPSAIVRFWTTQGSARVPVSADSVQFQLHAQGGDPATDLAATPNELHTARCVDPECSTWTMGLDEPGRFAVYAEACGERYYAEAGVELDADGCHAVTELVDIEVDNTKCAVDSLITPPGKPECSFGAHPSVHVAVVRRYDDYFAPIDVDMVWFEHEGRTHEARCLQGENPDECVAWMAGYDLIGDIEVSTEWCDRIVSKTVKVEPEADGCHARTEFMLLEVSTAGCKTAEIPDQPLPRPPFDLTTARADDGRPDVGSDDLTTRTPTKGDAADEIKSKIRPKTPPPFIDDLKGRDGAPIDDLRNKERPHPPPREVPSR